MSDLLWLLRPIHSKTYIVLLISMPRSGETYKKYASRKSKEEQSVRRATIRVN